MLKMFIILLGFRFVRWGKNKIMTQKEELIKRLGTLSDKAYLKYLMQTGWCVREIVELSITHDWSDIDIEEELKWLKEENIGEDVCVVANEA